MDSNRDRAIEIVMRMPLGGLCAVLALALLVNVIYWLWLT